MGKGNGFNDTINSVISNGDSSCYVLRFDFFSKPGFVGKYVDLLDKALRKLSGAEEVYRNLRYEHKILPPAMRRMVDIDSVAESLDCSLEEVLSLEAHIYADITPLLKPMHEDEPFYAFLVVTSYYVCIHIRNISFDETFFDLFACTYVPLLKCWEKGLVSMTDVQMLIYMSQNVGDDVFRRDRIRCGFKHPGDSTVASKKVMKQFAVGDVEYTVNNILIKNDVDYDIEGDENADDENGNMYPIWTFSTSCVVKVSMIEPDSLDRFRERYADIMLEAANKLEDVQS